MGGSRHQVLITPEKSKKITRLLLPWPQGRTQSPYSKGAQVTKTASSQKGPTAVMLFRDCDGCVLSP